jgi:hypothetical protein
LIIELNNRIMVNDCVGPDSIRFRYLQFILSHILSLLLFSLSLSDSLVVSLSIQFDGGLTFMHTYVWMNTLTFLSEITIGFEEMKRRVTMNVIIEISNHVVSIPHVMFLRFVITQERDYVIVIGYIHIYIRTSSSKQCLTRTQGSLLLL